MFGLAILGIFIAYLILSIAVIVIAMKWARKRNKSQDKAALIAIFIMFSLVFWDLIPVYAVRAYQCNVNAGFTVYKTVDEWKLENPSIAETLRPDDLPEQYLVETKNYDKFYQLPNGDVLKAHFSDKEHKVFSSAQYQTPDGINRYWLNSRFAIEYQDIRVWHTIIRDVEQLIDVKTNKVMAKRVDFRTSIPPLALGVGKGFTDWKFWLRFESCPRSKSKSKWFIDGNTFSDIRDKFKYINGEIQ